MNIIIMPTTTSTATIIIYRPNSFIKLLLSVVSFAPSVTDSDGLSLSVELTLSDGVSCSDAFLVTEGI